MRQLSLYGVKVWSSEPSLYPDHPWNRTRIMDGEMANCFDFVVENLCGVTLSQVFFGIGETIQTQGQMSKLHWDACLERAEALLADLKDKAKHFSYNCYPLKIREFNGFGEGDKPVESEKEAIEVYKKEVQGWEGREGSCHISGPGGEFFAGEPLEVVALVLGSHWHKERCVYVIHRADLSWYVQAAEILAKEFIPLAILNKDSVRLVDENPD